jgi:hypothetical protein
MAIIICASMFIPETFSAINEGVTIVKEKEEAYLKARHDAELGVRNNPYTAGMHQYVEYEDSYKKHNDFMETIRD